MHSIYSSGELQWTLLFSKRLDKLFLLKEDIQVNMKLFNCISFIAAGLLSISTTQGSVSNFSVQSNTLLTSHGLLNPNQSK
jgi:hypothetical protein